jgi:hypothetical protein
MEYAGWVNAMRPPKSLVLSVICTAWLSLECHSVAAGNELQTHVSAEDLILVDNPVSAEQTALNEIEDSVRQNPAQAPDIVTRALRTEVPHPVPMSCEIVRAAIAGFGKQITRIEVARTVYAAVQASPNETLSFVAVAIEDTRPALHQDVVGSAIAAVPDPYACVSPNSLHATPCNPGPTPAPNGHGVLHSDNEAEPQAVVSTPIQSEPCHGTTLAEAILQVALLSGATESEFALYPDSGIGELAYDALITKDPPLAPTPPPTPPPVSP